MQGLRPPLRFPAFHRCGSEELTQSLVVCFLRRCGPSGSVDGGPVEASARVEHGSDGVLCWERRDCWDGALLLDIRGCARQQRSNCQAECISAECCPLAGPGDGRLDCLVEPEDAFGARGTSWIYVALGDGRHRPADEPEPLRWKFLKQASVGCVDNLHVESAGFVWSMGHAFDWGGEQCIQFVGCSWWSHCWSHWRVVFRKTEYKSIQFV